jgi:2-iminobutanoate/2-iminopropanoate deaminase
MNSTKAPAAVGPYSHAVVCNMPSTAYISGQLPLCPTSGAMLGGDSAAEQAKQCLSNLDKILYRVNANRNTVTKTTVLLTDLADFADVNKVYAEFFGDHAPARVCYQVTALPKGAKVEIDAIAGTYGPRRPRRSTAGTAETAEAAAPADKA